MIQNKMINRLKKTNLIQNPVNFFKRLYRARFSVLQVAAIRIFFCKTRFRFLKKNMRFYTGKLDSNGDITVSHNLGALQHDAAFGMGGRMALLIQPTSCLLRDIQNPKVLIVGPRTEDDIFWAKSLGMHDSIGLDLFSYSNLIELGDIHHTSYASNTFDAIILGWVISYSSKPELLIQECKRIVKNNGLLCFGIESLPDFRDKSKPNPRINKLNSVNDIEQITSEKTIFLHDLELNVPTDQAIIFKVSK